MPSHAHCSIPSRSPCLEPSPAPGPSPALGYPPCPFPLQGGPPPQHITPPLSVLTTAWLHRGRKACLLKCWQAGQASALPQPGTSAEGAWAATGWSPELGLEGPYRPSSRATGRSKKEQSTGCGSQFIIIMESTSRGCFPPRPWPMLQGRPGKSTEGTQCPWEDVPQKAPTEMGQPGHGQGCATAKRDGSPQPRPSLPAVPPQLSVNLGYSCADSVLS